MSIPGYDAYWENYQLNHDPQMQDRDDDQEEDSYLDYCDMEVDERLLERK